MNEFYEYKCLNCASNIITSKNVELTNCIYCKCKYEKNIITEDKLKIKNIIQFNTSKKDAIEVLNKSLKGKKFLIDFKVNEAIKELKAIYIPVCIGNYLLDGKIQANCKKYNEWKNGNFKYKKIDEFTSIREGKVSFKNVLINSSKYLDDDILYSVGDYDYSNIVKIDLDKLQDNLFDINIVDKKTYETRIIKKIKNDYIEAMKKDITGYADVDVDDFNMKLKNFESTDLLVPLWILNIKSKNSIYTFLMNGQNKKYVFDVKVNFKRYIIVWIIIFIIVLISIIFLFYLGVIK